MNTNQLDSNSVALIGIGLIIFIGMMIWSRNSSAKSGSCLNNISEFFGSLLLIFLFIYIAYPGAWSVKEKSNPHKTERKDSNKPKSEEVYNPPDTLPPQEPDHYHDFTPNRQRRYNVSPILADTIPSLDKLYDPDIEDKIYNGLEPRHFYIQLSAGPSEDRMLKVKASEEAKSNLNFYIGYDQLDVDYPFKLLVGPFDDRKSAKKAWKGQKVWVRDLRETKQLVILTYP